MTTRPPKRGPDIATKHFDAYWEGDSLWIEERRATLEEILEHGKQPSKLWAMWLTEEDFEEYELIVKKWRLMKAGRKAAEEALSNEDVPA